ncbi:MAG: pyridoxine 5'-phosphate synthase [Natronospirillum sp.]
MTVLSVNLNKIALLRNSRGRDFPNVLEYAGRFIKAGAGGITVHPRPDERHIKYDDARQLSEFLEQSDAIELNIEGYPSDSFLQLIAETRPAQCTLVPDAANQLTSDHGWDFHADMALVKDVVVQLQELGVRCSLFLDPDPGQVELAAETGAERIELYTELYAEAFDTGVCEQVLAQYRESAELARSLGMGVNAGHDLDLQNLPLFLTIPDILEVSIGHALTVECINNGMSAVMKKYLAICHDSH